MNEGKENKDALKYALFIGIPVIIILGVLGAYYQMTNPMSILTKTINATHQNLVSMFGDSKQNIRMSDTPIHLEGELKFNTDLDLDMLSELQKYNYNFGLDLDMKNQVAAMNLKLKEENKEIIEGTFYQIGNKQYLNSKQVTEGLLEISNGEQEFDEVFNFEQFDQMLMKINTDDIKYLLKAIKEAFLSTLDKEYLTREKTDITIQGRQVKTTKIAYSLSQENLKRTNREMTKILTNDKEFMRIFSDLSGMKEEEIKEEFLDESNITSDYNLSIYTEGWNQDIVRVSIFENNVDMLTYLDYDNVKTINFSNDLILTIKSMDKEKWEIDYNLPDSKITGTIITTGKEIDNNNSEGTLYLKINSSDFNLELNTNVKMETNGQIKTPDTTNSKKLEDLTPSEQGKLFENLEEALDGTFFIHLIESNMM